MWKWVWKYVDISLCSVDENSQFSKDQRNSPGIVFEPTPITNETEVYMFDTTSAITSDTA